VPDEVGQTGGVNHVDEVALVVEVDEGGVEGVLVGLLLVGVVRDGVALKDGAESLGGPGGEEKALDEGGFARPSGSHQDNVADVGGWAGGHG
jgi:hypothetical protein